MWIHFYHLKSPVFCVRSSVLLYFKNCSFSPIEKIQRDFQPKIVIFVVLIHGIQKWQTKATFKARFARLHYKIIHLKLEVMSKSQPLFSKILNFSSSLSQMATCTTIFSLFTFSKDLRVHQTLTPFCVHCCMVSQWCKISFFVDKANVCCSISQYTSLLTVFSYLLLFIGV